MDRTIIGIFNNRSDADDAIAQLERERYAEDELSVLMLEKQTQTTAETDSATVGEATATGAGTGALIGGVAGLLIGIGAIAIPGIGGLLIGGPLAAALGITGTAAIATEGAISGAVAGGLIGLLSKLGIPQEKIKMYEEQIKSGGILLAVPVKDNNDENIKSVLNNHDVRSVDSITFT